MMGGKKTMEDSRKFEKKRRDKLNAAFEELSKLLPEHDPSVTLSKIEILRRTAAYIKELQLQNEEIIQLGSDSVLKNESEKLKKRVTNLVFKTKELVDVLRSAGVAIPNGKGSKKKKLPNQNQKVPAVESGGQQKRREDNRVKCGCLKEGLKEEDAKKEAIPTDSITVSPLPIPLSTASLTSSDEMSERLQPLPNSVLTPTILQSTPFQTANIISLNNDSNLSKVNPTLIPVSLKNKNIIVKEVIPPNLNGKTFSVVTTTSSKVVTTQTIVNSTALITVPQNSITTGQVIAPSVPVVENNIISNFGPGTLILTDGRLVLPQILVKQQPTVILMPAPAKMEPLLMPKGREVTKTTFTNKAPIPAIPSFRLELYPKIRPKKKVKPNLKRVEKEKKVVKVENKVDFKRRRVELDNSLPTSQSEMKKTIDLNNKEIPKDKIEELEGIEEVDETSLNDKINLVSHSSTGITECENDSISSLNTEELITCSGTTRVEEETKPMEPVHDQASSNINIELLTENTETSIPTIQVNVEGIDEQLSQSISNSSLSLSKTSEKARPVCSEASSQAILASAPTQDNLNEQLSTSLIDLGEANLNNEVNTGHRSEPEIIPKILFDNVVDEGKVTDSIPITSSSTNEQLKEVICNIPPCISSSTIQDSLFVPTSQALQLDEHNSLSFPNEQLSNEVSLTSDASKITLEPGNSDSTDKVSMTSDCENIISSNPSREEVNKLVLNERIITTGLSKYSTDSKSNDVTNKTDLSDDNNKSNVNVEKELVSENSHVKANISHEHPIPIGISNLSETCGARYNQNNHRNEDKENKSTQSIPFTSSISTFPQDTKRCLQSSCNTLPSGSLPELPISKTHNTDSFQQSDSKEQNKVSSVSTSNSKSAQTAPASTFESDPSFSSSKVSSNNENLKASSYTCNDKSDALSYISPVNSSNSIYTGYPSVSYYSNEPQVYPRNFIPKSMNPSTIAPTDKSDDFGNNNTSLPVETGDKCLYPQNISAPQSSLLKSSQLDKGHYSKTLPTLSANTWESTIEKEKPTFHGNRSKSSEKENVYSEKGYSGFQGDSISTINNGNLFSNFSSNPSALPVSCGFIDTPSVFSHSSSCSSVTTYPYHKSTTSDLSTQEQTYIANIPTSVTIPNSLMSTDKLNIGYYSNSSQCNEMSVSVQSSISMYSSFVPNNVYGNSSIHNTQRSYPLVGNNATIQQNSFNSSQASTNLFNYNNTTQTGVAPLISTSSDMYPSNKLPTSATFGFPSKSSSTNSIAYSMPSSHVLSTRSFQTNSSNGNSSSLANGSVYTNYSQLHLSSHGVPSSLATNTSSSLQRSISSVHSVPSLSNSLSQVNTPDLYPTCSLHTDTTNLFNNFPLPTTVVSTTQPQINVSTGCLASKSNFKSGMANQTSGNGTYTSSFQADNSNIFGTLPVPSISSVQISLPQPIATAVYTTATATNKPPVFTQANSAGIYSSSMQIDRVNVFPGMPSKNKSEDSAIMPSLPKSNDLPWNAPSLSTNSSINSTQTNNSRGVTQISGPGIYTTSSQSDITTALSSIVQCKIPPSPNISTSAQNNSSAKSVQTNQKSSYINSFQSDTINVFPGLPIQSTQATSSLMAGSAIYTSSTSINSANEALVPTNDPRGYSRSKSETVNIFSRLPLPSQSGSQSTPLQGNVFTTSDSFQQSNEPHTTSSSIYDKKNNNNIKNICISGPILNSELTSKSVNNECNQLIRSSNKDSDYMSNLNASTCDSQNNNNKETNFVNQQVTNKVDSNNTNDNQRNLSKVDCAYLNNKDILPNSYPSSISKGSSSDAAKRQSFSNNLQDSGNIKVDQKSTNLQSTMAISNETNIPVNNPNSIHDKPTTECNENMDKSVQRNSKSYNVPSINSNLSSGSESVKQTPTNHKSVSTEIIGTNYNCNIVNPGSYSKSFQSHNTVPTTLTDSSFQGTCYSNYNSTSFDTVTSQYNGTLLLSNRETANVCTTAQMGSSSQTYENVSKGLPLSATSETVVEKQDKSIQKPYTLGNPLKGDAHLDLLKSKEIEKNTFIPIGYEDMRLPSDFSSDLFSSLQVPTGGQHAESISPTAAFLLAFPLVSTSKNAESLNETENHENQTSTPTTILQIGNIDPPTTELFHPIDFQKSHTKSTDQFDINNDYLQLPDLNEKQNSSYKRCEKRKDTFSDYGKDIRSSKQKSKLIVTTTSTYSHSYTNPLSCNDYQFCEKDSSQWQQEFPSNISKEQKKNCDRKRDKLTQKGCFHQNYQQDCYNYKEKKRKQQNRISVNWMSTPENREQTDYQQKEAEGIMAPPAQTIYSGISLDFPSDAFPDLSNVKKVNNYSWSPSKTLLPSLDSHLMIPSTLPTLVGDLALGTNTPSESYKTFETPKLLPTGPLLKKTPEKLDEAKKRNDFPKSQANFFSVSQLVDPKSKKQKTGDRNYRRLDKNAKSRSNFHCPKRKEDHCMFYEDKNNFIPNGSQYPEKRIPYKGGSYSAESLIGSQNQELEFPPSFNYQQNTNYFQNEFSNNADSSNQQYGYLQQTQIGNYNQEECQDFGYGAGQRGLDTVRQKSTRKEDNYVREGGSIPAQLSSYPPYSKSINYSLPPPPPNQALNTNTTTTLTNFNLSTIFPEMNDQRVATSGQPSQPINQTFPSSQNYRGHLPQ